MAQDEVWSSGGMVADCTYCTLPFSFRVNLRLHAHHKSSSYVCPASLHQLLVVLVLDVTWWNSIGRIWGRNTKFAKLSYQFYQLCLVLLSWLEIFLISSPGVWQLTFRLFSSSSWVYVAARLNSKNTHLLTISKLARLEDLEAGRLSYEWIIWH
jgi:hypothetical protein